MTTKIRLLIIVVLVFAGFAAAVDLVNFTAVNDTFTDRERHTQDTPYSLHWFTRWPAEALFVNTDVPNYRLETDERASHQIWTHFTGQNYAIPNSLMLEPVTLKVGETIKVVMRFKMLEAADTSWNNALMFGLFNSNGTRDTADYTGTGGQRLDDTGYFVITNPGRTTDGYAKLNKVTEGTSTDHFVSFVQLATFRSYNMAMNDTDVDISVTRVDETTLSLSARVGPGYIISGVLDTPSDASYFTFDTISILVDGRAFPDDTVAFSLDNVWVTYDLFPSTCEQVVAFGGGFASDINDDCNVDYEDFALVATDWLKCNDPNDITCE